MHCIVEGREMILIFTSERKIPNGPQTFIYFCPECETHVTIEKFVSHLEIIPFIKSDDFQELLRQSFDEHQRNRTDEEICIKI
ncbi:TPA: hypothetical protein DEP58_01030 [Patescibacteria group bacterium]|nr:MAG: hypothetical protein UU98_C0033G0008 [Parcubacteria group bacterium GW2011_GWD2_42_14]HCC04873.1 hypothetical protein [Patescibacteria group bacterium]